MAIHNFSFGEPGPKNLQDLRFEPKTSSPAGAVERNPKITDPINFPDQTGRDDIFFDNTNINIAEDVREILPQGFRTMDRGIKNYFSGIRIPTTDDFRMMTVRISGGDKSFLIWRQDLGRGRVTLPVMSINRGAANRYEDKYSPPFHAMRTRFVDKTGSRAANTFRPVPYLIDYTLTIWAEHKKDAELATYQINTRFHPLAEFVVEDEHLKGNVIMRFNGWKDSSDKDVDAETRPNIRYDIDITMEGWLPLPEKLVPTILGKVITMKEITGEFLQVASGINKPQIS